MVVFLEIHPFQDGNGRISRALTTLMLLQAGYAYVPYSSLESVVELNKETYYLALRQTQGTIRADAPNWQPWLVFFLRTLTEQVRRLEKKVEREQLILAKLPELSLQIMELVRERGRTTMAEMVQAHRREPQHPQTPPAQARRTRTPRPARQRPRRVVRLALIKNQ